MTSATGSPSPIARRRQVRPNLWHMGVLQLHATNLRVAAHPLSIADDPMRGCRAYRMCTMPILRNIQAPISCARSSPHLHCITRKKHVAPNACVRASRKLRARGKKPCLGCPTHNHALAPSESRNWLRSLCPQPYLIQSRATWQPGCLTPRDFFYTLPCTTWTRAITKDDRCIVASSLACCAVVLAVLPTGIARGDVHKDKCFEF
jgi:hypothetical protein